MEIRIIENDDGLNDVVLSAYDALSMAMAAKQYYILMLDKLKNNDLEDESVLSVYKDFQKEIEKYNANIYTLRIACSIDSSEF